MLCPSLSPIRSEAVKVPPIGEKHRYRSTVLLPEIAAFGLKRPLPDQFQPSGLHQFQPAPVCGTAERGSSGE